MVRKSPCPKDCPRRSWNCHASCPEYASYFSKNREDDKKRLEKVALEDYEKTCPRTKAKQKTITRYQKRMKSRW